MNCDYYLENAPAHIAACAEKVASGEISPPVLWAFRDHMARLIGVPVTHAKFGGGKVVGVRTGGVRIRFEGAGDRDFSLTYSDPLAGADRWLSVDYSHPLCRLVHIAAIRFVRRKAKQEARKQARLARRTPVYIGHLANTLVEKATQFSKAYRSHCWKDSEHEVNDFLNPRCTVCGWVVCPDCGSCVCDKYGGMWARGWKTYVPHAPSPGTKSLQSELGELLLELCVSVDLDAQYLSLHILPKYDKEVAKSIARRDGSVRELITLYYDDFMIVDKGVPVPDAVFCAAMGQ